MPAPILVCGDRRAMIFRAERLYGVDHKLVSIILGAGMHTDFIVTCGIRTIEEQTKLFELGKSQTMASKHLVGKAVDLAVMIHGEISWSFPDYVRLSSIVKDVAKRHKVVIAWGGDWITFKDGPHFELAGVDV